MADIVVRRATTADLDALRTVLTCLHDGPPWTDQEAPAAAAALAQIMADPQRALLLGLIDHEPAGTIDVSVSTNLTRHVSPFAVVENVVVVPHMRRRGLGRRLMQAGLEFARLQGCYKAQLVSANKRDAAHHLYSAMGFDADVSGYRRYLTDVD
jgi:GNAT superfamily N-acetyltransferase